MKNYVLIFFFSFLLAGCLQDPTDYGALVPPTVDQAPELPSLPINIDGQYRLIHYRTFGDPANPTLFIMHGSLSDMRAYLPLQEFQEKYHLPLFPPDVDVNCNAPKKGKRSMHE